MYYLLILPKNVGLLEDFIPKLTHRNAKKGNNIYPLIICFLIFIVSSLNFIFYSNIDDWENDVGHVDGEGERFHAYLR